VNPEAGPPFDALIGRSGGLQREITETVLDDFCWSALTSFAEYA
jgi:hypothetical protein